MKPVTNLTISAVALVLFICLTVLVIAGSAQGLNDFLSAHTELVISPALTAAAIFISNVGQWYVYLPISVVFIILPRTRLKIGVPVAISISVSAIANNVMKIIFAVPRPMGNQLVQESGFGYPSGHVMNCTVFAGMFVYLFLRYSGSRPRKVFFLVAAAVFALLMGFCRVYLGVHTVTDALGGYLAGFVVLFASAGIMGKLHEKSRRPRDA